MTATKDKPLEGDFNAVLYDVFHSMSQPSMQGKTWGDLLEYAKTHLTPIVIRAAEENAALDALAYVVPKSKNPAIGRPTYKALYEIQQEENAALRARVRELEDEKRDAKYEAKERE